MLKLLSSLAVLILVAGCGEDADPPEYRASIVGEWETAQALSDGEIQDGWSDMVIRFDQDSELKGSYHTSGIPDESVWSSKGRWWMEDRDAAFFTREDSIVVDFTAMMTQ